VTGSRASSSSSSSSSSSRRRGGVTRNREPRIPPISSRPPFRSPLARASAIDDSRFYVSLFIVAARRATATGVRGDIRRNCEGCERVETARATSLATGRFERERKRERERERKREKGRERERERARENSSSLFMSFLFDLLSSRSRPPLFVPLPLSPSLASSSRRECESGAREVARMGKRVESARGGTSSPEGCRKSLVCRGRKKSDVFPRDCWGRRFFA